MASRDDEKEFHHESYGMVGFYRVTGNTGRLFGSSLKNQSTSIHLRIAPGMRVHHLSRDWYRPESGGHFIDVELSAAQFAELLTSMNMGAGVPCTIRRLNGKQMENPPDELLEAEQIKLDFSETTDKLLSRLEVVRTEVTNVVNKKTPLTLADKKRLTDAIGMVVQQIKSNIPFVAEQFHEATTKIVSSAKAEVDAFMTHAIQLAGLQAIAENRADAPRLPTGELSGRGTGPRSRRRILTAPWLRRSISNPFSSGRETRGPVRSR
jgi:hypothetical protein